MGEIIIQVNDKAGVTLEQFPLRVAPMQHGYELSSIESFGETDQPTGIAIQVF